MLSILDQQLPLPSGRRYQVTYVPIMRSLRKFLALAKSGDVTKYSQFTFDNFQRINDPIFQIRTVLDYFHKGKSVTLREKQKFIHITCHLLMCFPVNLYTTGSKNLKAASKKREK
jgi:NAD-dependent oxidoreductase involved in siderophore biosynthesis